MTDKKLTKAEWGRLEKALCRVRKPVWSLLTGVGRAQAMDFCEGYKAFLGEAKTERETVAWIDRTARRHGFLPADEAGSDTGRLLWNFRGKAAALAVVGRRPLARGVRIIASHVDAPRLDLKQNPLYEDLNLAFLKTHYYGGIKKFQWVARPLALHGLVLKEDGTEVHVRIGEAAGDPVFTINDILPHLASKIQGDKKLSEAVPAEKLNILVGGLPLAGPDGSNNPIKLGLLKMLHERYGLVEEDLISAELEIVPAGGARDVGLDGAFVGAYGQDDRACAYCSLWSVIELESPETTAIALFLDKEEIGSDGNTGAKSRFLELILYDLMRRAGGPLMPDSVVRTLWRSKAISADVTAGVDPDYIEVHEKGNDALVGYGVCLTKYTGSRGKLQANDAHAEYVNWVRRSWNRAAVVWQAGELGKVDVGGGGTVAKYLAQHGLDILDAGPPLLSMHSPFEVAHKADVFMSYRAFQAFFSEKETPER